MTSSPTSDQVKERAQELGFELAGVCTSAPPRGLDVLARWLAAGHHGSMEYMARHAELRADPSRLLPGARSVVAVGLGYNQDPTHEPGYPRIARYALGRDYHKVLRAKLRSLGRWVQDRSPGSQVRVCVDSAPLLEREYAVSAGLGWIGKNTCLIDSHRGSWFVLGFLLTSLELAQDEPAVGGCGTCSLCIDACPTGAIVREGERWVVASPRCISYLTIEHRGELAPELAAKIGDWTFGCDICQEVCPFNMPREHHPRRAMPTREADFGRRTWPTLRVLADIERPAWDEVTRGTAVRRAGYEGLKRNARINLANAKR